MNNLNSIKSKLKAGWIISLIALCLNAFLALIDIYDFTSSFDVGLDIFDLGCCIFSFIVFLQLSNKGIEYLKKKNGLLLAASILSIFSSFLVAIFGFLAFNEIKNFRIETLTDSAVGSDNNVNNDASVNANKSENSNPNQTEKEVYPAEELLSKLKVLQKMKTDGELSDVEYESLKKKMIDDFKGNIK